ncbi:hypothetical protein BH09PAT3_BH09PAT3_1970 [soil metagenome]
MIDPNVAIDAHYDRLDTQGQLNASQMRELSGMVPDGDFSAAAIEARLGIVPADSTAETAEAEDTRKSDFAPMLGSTMCGDCLVTIAPGSSCGHITVPKTGKRNIING